MLPSCKSFLILIFPLLPIAEADPLERRIADAVYAAEDIIEAQIVVQIHKRSTSVEDHSFYTNLQNVIEEMDLITKEVQKIGVEAQLQQKPVAPLTTSYSTQNVMVGFEQVFLEVLDELTRDQRNRQIIPITGMGGIEKKEEPQTTVGHFQILKFVELWWCNCLEDWIVSCNNNSGGTREFIQKPTSMTRTPSLLIG
ncbi:uncharacterized protein LOC121760184 [Salvia splendens]|uniref:uncharacterized protein LOC121760184 n=1 Tax=Salvia splendens TaxID=180675 RepID=UPI001C269C36|nr:uncharacterized protein LOC121760184 [Salvia splendens]